MKHFKIKIKGKVQGVWYRASAQRMASSLGLTGFVRNQPDGSVYAEAEGPEDSIQAFVQWCRSGPELAEVTEVSVVEGAIQGFEQFQIQR